MVAQQARKASTQDPVKGERKVYDMKKLVDLKSAMPVVTQTRSRQVQLLQQIPLIPGDPEYVATLTLAYLRKKKAVLVFCPTRDGCQKMAKLLSEKLPIQFPEYKNVAKAQQRNSQKIQHELEFTELPEELEDIVAQVVSVKTKGKGMSRDTVYDISL